MKPRTHLIPLLLASIGGFLPIQSAKAGQAELEALLTSPSRPTMEQVLTAAGGVPTTNSFIGTQPNQFAMAMSQIKDIPKVIAFMEKAFPGATWAPLGRDAVIFGDLLDAFYLSIGQSGRVARLNASTSSFRAGDDALRVRLLEGVGLDLKDIKGTRPVVGLDRTGFSPQSQSTSVIRAGYAAYAAAGGNPADLIHHLNFMGLQANAPGTGMTSAVIDQYFSNVSVQGNPGYVGMISSIMQMQVGRWTDTTAWHNTFGPLGVQANGKVEGAVGSDFPLAHRMVLGEMIEVLSAVSQPEFIASVQAECRKLGFELPITNVDYEKILADRAKAAEEAAAEQRRTAQEKAANYPQDMSARFSTMTSTLAQRPTEAQTTYLTPGAQQAADWFEAELKNHALTVAAAPEAMKAFPANHVSLFFVAELTTLRKSKRISSRDYRRLLARALSATPVNEEFLTFFGRIYDHEPTLREALKEKAEFFLTTFKNKRRPGTENTEAVYRRIRDAVMKLPPDCPDVFANPVVADKAS